MNDIAQQKPQPLSADEARALVARVAESRNRVLTELRKVVVGQEASVDLVLAALFSGGHCLLTGVPGLAKTLLVRTLAQILDLGFRRIQFTPDLMPSDITGTEVLDETDGIRALRFVRGPVFTQLLLADEINRTPPKTQAALLEAMQEGHVTAAGRSYALEPPFFVLATQNPIELEGTYPLPEAQLDRFLFNIVMTYLPEDDEVKVVTQTTGVRHETPNRVLSREDILQIQQLVRHVVVAEDVARYAVRLSAATRPTQPDVPDFVEEVRQVGRRPARLAGAGARRQGARADARARLRHARGHPDAGRAGVPSPRPHQLPGRVGRPHHGCRGRAAPRAHHAARERARPDDGPHRARPVAVPVAGGGGGPRHARTQGSHHRRGAAARPAPESFRGSSVEFAEYRQYMPGDDPSTVDWKVYARSDRHYVKKFEHDTNVEVQLLVDTSASMAYRSGTGMTKLQYAQCLTAALAYLLTGQRDAVGLGLYDDQLRDYVPSAVKAGQLTRLLIALDHATPARHRTPPGP